MLSEFTKGSRTRLLAILLIAVMALFVIRLFFIQIIQHKYYMDQADSEYIKQLVLHARRGEIYALDGADKPVPLVINETVYTVWADPTAVQDTKKIADVITRVAGGNARKDFAQYLTVPGSLYQVLATKVSRVQAELIKKENLAGVGFDAVSQRVYPEGQLASQILGFVNNNGDGQYGFEQFNNDDLKGKNGLLQTVTDVRNVPLTIGDKNIKTPAVDGKDMVLTVDRNIQAKVEQTLAAAEQRTHAKHISAIVMDPNTGKVLAMANMPTYDASKRNEVTDIAVFNNPTINNPYEVGSVAKTFTVATGLDKGVITAESTYNNTGSIVIDDTTINNTDKTRLIGTITIQQALDWSLNTGMVTVAERLGNGSAITYGSRQTLYDYFHNRFRLGKTTGIQLAGEQAGDVISPDDAQGNAVRYSNMSFGQGMDVSMVQAVGAFSAIINGGTYYQPTVVAGYMKDGTYVPYQIKPEQVGVISPSASQVAREMIHHAHYATYKPADKDGYYIGGKTGTSQTIDPKTGQYRNDETIATFLGFGGNDPDKPSYVIMTTVSGGGNFGGGADAKPIFNDISNWLLDYLKLQPKG